MVEGKSEREAARYFGVHRQTVKKMCQYAMPPGYRRKSAPVSPKLAAFTGIIDAILEADKTVHAKQRLTAPVYWNDCAMSMDLPAAIPSCVIMFIKPRFGKRRCSCRWHICLATLR